MLAVALLGAAVPEPPGAGNAPPPGSPFPSPQRLDDLKQTPLPERLFAQDVATVEEWTLTGPFPDVVAAVPYRDPTEWGGLLEVAAEQRAGLVVATEAMQCAAREWALFYQEHRTPPGPQLRNYMAARCSTVAPNVQFHHFEGGVPAGASDPEIFESWRGAVASLLSDALRGGPQTAGIWYGRRDGRAIVVIASGERLVRVDPLPTASFDEVRRGDGEFVLSGELLVPADDVSAAVNVGPFGAAACERAVAPALPRFAFRCKLDRADARSWLTVSLTPPGRLLGRSAIDVVLWPSGQPDPVWRRASRGAAVPLTPETDRAQTLLTLVNRARKEAGREPLALSRPQSRVADELAPFYFASAFGVTPGTGGDLVVLGLLAGWNVEGIVQDARFTSSWVVKTADLDHLVASVLEYPAGRATLLDPEAEQLAVGTVSHEGSGFLAGIFGTYAIFEEASHADAARQVIEALDAARAGAGKGPVRHLPTVASLGTLAAGRVQSGEDADVVLGDLLRQSSQVLRRSVNGWILEARDLAELRFPEALLARDPVEIAIGVSHHKPAGEAWGRYVILVVAAEPAGQGA